MCQLAARKLGMVRYAHIGFGKGRPVLKKLRIWRWRTAALLGLAALWLAAKAGSPLLAANRLDRSAEPAATVVLYDGALGTSPSAQGLAYLSRGGQAPELVAGGATSVDTMGKIGIMAGYLASSPGRLPALERAKGYTIRFAVQVQHEDHAGSARNNDGLDDRAGFSVIALSSDTRGIELGFWRDRIWAQEGGSGEDLFTQAEGAPFDTSAAMVRYDLTVRGDTYRLSVGTATILAGKLRDYTAFTGPIDPYQTPNFLYFGDNTSSARARFRIALVQVTAGLGPEQLGKPRQFLPMVQR